MLDARKTIQLLLDHGADINNRIRQGWTPLHLAVRSGKVDAVRLLLQHGANVNDEDMFHSTALYYASSGHGEGFEITRVLLECGANVNARNMFNTTPLETASISGRDDIVQLLF